MIRMLGVLILSFLSMNALSEENLAQDNSYKTEVLRYSHLIGPLDNLAVTGYTSNEDIYNPVIDKFNNKILDTQKQNLSVFTYYPNNKKIKISLIYGYGKLYEVYVTLYIEPTSSVRSYYRKDLKNYLESKEWEDTHWFHSGLYYTDSYLSGDNSIKAYFETRFPATISLTKNSMHDEYSVYAEKQRILDEKNKNEEDAKKLNDALKIK